MRAFPTCFPYGLWVNSKSDREELRKGRKWVRGDSAAFKPCVVWSPGLFCLWRKKKRANLSRTKMLCRPRNPWMFRNWQKTVFFLIRKTLVEVQSGLAASRNDLPFAHLHLLLWQSPACVCRLQPAHPSPENKLVLGNCWFHFANSPFVSDYPCQTWGSPLVLSSCLAWNPDRGGRDVSDGLSECGWGSELEALQKCLFIAAEEDTRNPELQTLYTGCVSGRVGVVPGRRNPVRTMPF